MPFGRHKGKILGQVPTDYIRWCLDNLDGISQDLRRALYSELAKRDDPGPRRQENYYRARSAAAASPLSLDEAEDRFICLLLQAEREGVFQGGAHLDNVWELVAVAFEKFRRKPGRLSPRRVA
jgi:hypothetical protein